MDQIKVEEQDEIKFGSRKRFSASIELAFLKRSQASTKKTKIIGYGHTPILAVDDLLQKVNKRYPLPGSLSDHIAEIGNMPRLTTNARST